MSSVIHLTGPNTVALSIPSSFVATTSEQSLDASGPVGLADFWIGPGGWIIQVKATVRTFDPTEQVDVKFRLAVPGNPIAEDVSLTTVRAGCATVALALGVHLSGNAHVELTIAKQHAPGIDVSNIVIVAVKEDNLTLVKL